MIDRKLLNDLSVAGNLPLPPLSTTPSGENVYVYRKPTVNKFSGTPTLRHKHTNSDNLPRTSTTPPLPMSQMGGHERHTHSFSSTVLNPLPLSTDELRRLPINSMLSPEQDDPFSWLLPHSSNASPSFLDNYDTMSFPYSMAPTTDVPMPADGLFNQHYANMAGSSQQGPDLPTSSLYPDILEQTQCGASSASTAQSFSMWIPTVSVDSFA